MVEQFSAAYEIPITFVQRSGPSSGTRRYFDLPTAEELDNFTVDTDFGAYIAQADKYQ